MQRLIERVLHPTDFSEASKIAFYHALKAALLAKSKLTLLNVSPDATARWSDFPGVRETLERWALLPPGSPKSAVADLGIDVRKEITRKRDPVDAVVNYIEQYPTEMIVLSTSQKKGVSRWLSGSVAEPIARKATEMTLFISSESRGFISADDGSVSLENVLIPVAPTPHPQPAIEAAARLVKSLQRDQGTFTLLHVGNTGTMPAVNTPEVTGWDWNKDSRQGDVIQTIIDASNDTRADLIVMATDGRNGFLDGLRGSHSERVLRQAGVPVLTVPVGSFVYDTIR
ncbi:MAG: universal stress protein [Pyrinomonadaceae bacterium]